MWRLNWRGLSMSMSACLHPLEESAINIDKGSKDFLIENINFEMFKRMSGDHSKRKIPTLNQEMLRKHEINNEFGNINSNAF